MTMRTDDTPPPPPGRIGPAPGPPDTVARANARRLDLIEQKYKGGGLSEAEQEELDACARAVYDWIAQTPYMRAQMEMMEAAEKRVEALVERAKARRRSRDDTA